MRITIFSPNMVGSVLTRKSIARWPDRASFILPSWGTRFSEMSSFEMTLMRVERRSLIASGGCAISRRTPSIRNRIR